MQHFLQLTPADQRLTIEQTAARMGWVASSVEKDFWVCWTLQQLFSMPGANLGRLRNATTRCIALVAAARTGSRLAPGLHRDARRNVQHYAAQL